MRAKFLIIGTALVISFSSPLMAVADFQMALTGASLAAAPSEPVHLGVDLLVVASESGEGDFHIGGSSDVSDYFPDGSPPLIEMTLKIKALDDGGEPAEVDFQGISWQLLDRAGQPGNTSDDYFFSSLDSPQELTSIFADLVYNTGLTLEEATWSGGLLPSTDPASVATFRSLIYLDPAHNFTGSGSLDLSMRVRLEAGRSTAVPEPAAILLAMFGFALLPRRRRR